MSVESFTQRQSKIEFDNVMFSKGNMFSIKESDFQVSNTISYPTQDAILSYYHSTFSTPVQILFLDFRLF